MTETRPLTLIKFPMVKGSAYIDPDEIVAVFDTNTSSQIVVGLSTNPIGVQMSADEVVRLLAEHRGAP